MGPIVVRAGANVQDGSVLHGGPDVTEIGEGATVGHGCIVHNATIGAEALIGNGAIVLDGATVGHHTLVAAGSIVTPGTVIGDGVLAVGSPARERGPLNEAQRLWVDGNPAAYRMLARRYSEGLRPTDPNV
jgi:carbonic anhydrase/acetyltransferase-like protein (isoleucine patch superfamily)